MKKLLCLILSLLLALPPLPAQAWSECGHHIIAVMAFDQLPPERQTELLRILKEHPRFAEDFKIPGNVKNEDHWLIGRAGYWPDAARATKEYNRPTWHYQLGDSKVIGNVPNVPEPPGMLPPDATLETQELYIGQAFELCRKTLRSTTESDSNKALAICWLAHIVADIHQPCHAGSLYVETVFPEGDRGANSVPTKQSKNLHALWDGLLGQRFDEGDVKRRIDQFYRMSGIVPANPLDFDDCVTRSRVIANEWVYTSEILEPISVAMRSNTTTLEPINLSETYLKRAGSEARIQALKASIWLAEILE